MITFPSCCYEEIKTTKLLGIDIESQMNNEPMSYEELLRRGVEAQMRGNEELSKALFSRAMDLGSEEQNKIERQN